MAQEIGIGVGNLAARADDGRIVDQGRRRAQFAIAGREETHDVLAARDVALDRDGAAARRPDLRRDRFGGGDAARRVEADRETFPRRDARRGSSDAARRARDDQDPSHFPALGFGFGFALDLALTFGPGRAGAAFARMKSMPWANAFWKIPISTP